MAASSMAIGHPAEIVPATGLVKRRQQRLLGRLVAQKGEVRYLHEALAGSTRVELDDRHRLLLNESYRPSKNSILSPSFSVT